jgi:hypothetical protein
VRETRSSRYISSSSVGLGVGEDKVPLRVVVALRVAVPFRVDVMGALWFTYPDMLVRKELDTVIKRLEFVMFKGMVVLVVEFIAVLVAFIPVVLVAFVPTVPFTVLFPVLFLLTDGTNVVNVTVS